MALPVYEYRCKSGHEYEKTEGFDAPTEQSCAACGAPARRQISMPAVIFKGSGFYSTDNRKSGIENGSSSSEPKPSASESDHSGDDGHGPPHGSESKVEAATE